MTDRRNGKFDRRAILFQETKFDDPEIIADYSRPERRKDAKLRAELDARSEAIMAGLLPLGFQFKKGLNASSMKFGVYAALRQGT